MVKVAAVVPTYNRWPKTQRFLGQFVQQTYADLTTIVVDADSPDGTAREVQQHYPDVILLQVSDQQYWAGATNAGVRYALEHGYDYIFTINDDAVVAPDHIQRLIALAQKHSLRIIGNRIDYLEPPHQVWALGTQLVWGTPRFLQLQYVNTLAEDLPADIMAQEILAVDALPGDGVLIHRSVFEQVGLYQAAFLPHYHADSELILRARRSGIEAYVAPHVVLQDDFSAAQKKQDFKRIAGLKYAFFHPKSHLFVPAIIYIFLRYCPWYAYPQTLYHLLMRLLRLGKSRPRTERSGR
ncbi:glycosyltransferase family 2 protein [Leptolyngbya sp. BC1307]|uniref:glycosyltransferase family 2 protein n=1 Tax=Leptolyngbya sp. BC1307 TaxID=2029589 RepID=UPI000EFC9823|nr:glycosyltransferase family 2 protein [Leptolyngbya sp. BC1307]